MKNFYIVVLCSLSTLIACAQNTFKYKSVPKNLIKIVNVDAEINNFKKVAYDAVNSLPPFFVKNATKDYTKYLQTAINSHQVVLLPDFPVLINDVGLKLKNNSILIFGANSKLILNASNKTGYSMLYIGGVSNVKVYNPKLEGDRNSHIGNSGEWGFGININKSNNISIYNVSITNCWGDGIYIGGSTYSSNVLISGGILDNNRRNGISIVGLKGGEIDNLLVSNSNGTAPETGVDIEPNNYKNKLGFELNSVNTFNNMLGGLSFHLGLLRNATDINNISIKVNDYCDSYSKYGISFSNLNTIAKKKLGGVFQWNNVSLNNNSKPFRFLYKSSSLDNINFNFNNLKVNGAVSQTINNDLKQFKSKRLRTN